MRLFAFKHHVLLLLPVALLSTAAWAAAPRARAGANQSVLEGQTVVLDGSGSSDEDGDALFYFWEQVSGTFVALSNPFSPTPSFTAPDVSGHEDLRFRLTVQDSGGASDSDATEVRVSEPVNRAPTANAGPDQIVVEGTFVTLNGHGSGDPDGNPLTYFWEQTEGPFVALDNPASPTPSFTAPAVAVASTLRFRLTVSDPAGLSSNDSVNITVGKTGINRAPTAHAGFDTTVAEGASVVLQGSGSDPDGDPITFSWSQTAGPTVTLSNPNSPTPSFTAPTVSARTELRFVLTVADNRGGSDTDDVVIAVINPSPINTPPTAHAGDDQVVQERALVTLDGGRSQDPDGNPLTFGWTQLSGPQVILNDPGSVRPVFQTPFIQEQVTIEFRLTVQDTAGATSDDTVVITVTDSPALNLPQEGGISNFIIAPNPFSPSERGAFLQYNLGQPSEVTINIVDLFGNSVRELVISPGSTGGTAGANIVNWDGRNGAGDVVASGGYIVHITAVDGQNSRTTVTDKAAVLK